MEVGERAMPSDDMALFLDQRPGCYFRVGIQPADGRPHPHHAPEFEMNEDGLEAGLRVALAVMRRTARHDEERPMTEPVKFRVTRRDVSADRGGCRRSAAHCCGRSLPGRRRRRRAPTRCSTSRPMRTSPRPSRKARSSTTATMARPRSATCWSPSGRTSRRSRRATCAPRPALSTRRSRPSAPPGASRPTCCSCRTSRRPSTSRRRAGTTNTSRPSTPRTRRNT